MTALNTIRVGNAVINRPDLMSVLKVVAGRGTRFMARPVSYLGHFRPASWCIPVKQCGGQLLTRDGVATDENTTADNENGFDRYRSVAVYREASNGNVVKVLVNDPELEQDTDTLREFIDLKTGNCIFEFIKHRDTIYYKPYFD